MKKLLFLGIFLMAAITGNSQSVVSCEGQEFKVDGEKKIWQKISGNWQHVGDRCIELTCDRRRVFCKSIDGSMWRYNGAPHNWTPANTLLAGQDMNGGTVMLQAHQLKSANGKHFFYMQENGDLGVWTHDPTPRNVWSSKTAKKDNCTLKMQGDGNLVVYDNGNRPIWSSQTHTSVNAQYGQAKYKPVKLVLEDNGRIVLYSATNYKVWDNVTDKYPLN